jgi:hypothetical protein
VCQRIYSSGTNIPIRVFRGGCGCRIATSRGMLECTSAEFRTNANEDWKCGPRKILKVFEARTARSRGATAALAPWCCQQNEAAMRPALPGCPEQLGPHRRRGESLGLEVYSTPTCVALIARPVVAHGSAPRHVVSAATTPTSGAVVPPRMVVPRPTKVVGRDKSYCKLACVAFTAQPVVVHGPGP